MNIDRVAFQVGPLTIYWYGIFIALAFIGSLLVMQWRGRQRRMSPDMISDACFLAMVGGILGARILYVVLNWDEFAGQPAEIIRIDHGGLVFFGGLFGGGIAASWYIWRKRLDVWEVADLFGLALPLGMALGRIGCFINGCCFGKPTDSILGVTYPGHSAIWATQVHKGLIPFSATQPLPVVPAQLIEFSLDLAIWIVLLIMARRTQRPGTLFALYLILYSVCRFGNEFNRGDYVQYTLGLTAAQWISIVTFPIGIYLLATLKKSSDGTANRHE